MIFLFIGIKDVQAFYVGKNCMYYDAKQNSVQPRTGSNRFRSHTEKP